MVTECEVKSNVQRIETGVFYILVDGRYEDECSVSVGTVRFASHYKIIDSHYDSLFAERPSSMDVARYGRAVKPVHRYRTINS